MSKCYICKSVLPCWAWQPFGPDPEWSFARLGSHYRGFAVLKVCQHCKADIQSYTHIEFEYQSKKYIVGHGVVVELPEYVNDGLTYYNAWLNGDTAPANATRAASLERKGEREDNNPARQHPGGY